MKIRGARAAGGLWSVPCLGMAALVGPVCAVLRISVWLCALGFGLVWSHAGWADCAQDRVALRGSWGEAQFTVEIADDPRERSQGLMFREVLAPSAGMLFIYDRPQTVAFWMKNTLIPLDMIFADESGTVRLVHHMARPGDLTPIQGGEDILVVLEINGGLARRLGIDIGSQMRHPAFADADAVWPC